MKNSKCSIFTSICLLITTQIPSFAQTTLTTADYTKALWMTTRFFGAQRMTDNAKSEKQQNWLVQGYTPSGVSSTKTGVVFAGDADAGYDLSGGWVDCGDHVFFGQTGFYAGYMLAKVYDVFPEGFDDYYSPYYNGYRAAGDYSWEGGKGIPNGIPDVLDELKHQTDFFIKCAKNSTTFYFEKGDGNADHTERVTAVKMQTNSVGAGGEPRKMWSNPNDASMPAMCSATLAVMSRIYRPFDPTYADLCLKHAKFAYDYSKSKSGVVGAASGSFYGGNDNFNNGRAIMFSEMYMATGTTSYKTEALALSAGITTETVRPNINYTFDYSNTGELALYTLAEVGHPNAKSAFNTHVNNKFINSSNYNAAGVYKNGGGWGKLRYVGNAALIVALYNKLNNSASLDAKVYANVDYILGKNSGGWSFLVGFIPQDNTPIIKTPAQAHHRNLYLYEGNNNNFVASIPTKNKQFGALVGGSLDGTYNDVWTEYVNTEVCVDYNVGIVGALAAIRKEKDPVDTNKFLAQCAKPNLGTNQSLCGTTGGITLNSGLTNNNVRTFEWFKDGVSQGAASKTATTRNISAGGEWSVKVDSLGKCSRIAKVTISATLPTIDLGADVDLCKPSSVTFATNISGNGITHVWTKNNQTITGQTSNNLVVTSAGTYKVTASVSGCASQTDEVKVTSSLPITQGDVFCSNSQFQSKAQLLVLSTGGPFEWYDVATGGTKLFTGTQYEVTPNATKTYYVKDAGSFAANLGPATMSGGTTEGAERSQMQFTAYSKFTLVSVDVIKGNYGGTDNENWIVEIYSDASNVPGTVVYTGVTTAIPKSDGNIQSIPINVVVDGAAAGTIYWLSIKQGGTLKYLSNFNYTTNNQISSGGKVVVALNQGRHDNNNSTTAGMAFNWKVSTGSDCDRTPVEAKQDCAVGVEDNATINIASIYPNPSTQGATLSLQNNKESIVQIYNISGILLDSFVINQDAQIGQDLKAGLYIIKIVQGENTQSLRFTKR